MSLKSDYLSSFGKTLSKRFNIRNNISKKRINKDLFIPHKNNQLKNNIFIDEKIKEECNFNISELKKRIKLLNKEEKENSENKKINNEGNNIFKKIFKGNNYHYHNNHILRMENLKKKGLLKKMNIQIQSFTPKYEVLYHKIITGPKWDNISDRSKNMFNVQNHITNLSYNNDSNYLKDNIKGFVDMSKQTKRKGIFDIQNNKIKNLKLKLNNQENPILLIFSKTSTNNESLLKKIDYKEKLKYAPDFNRYMSRDQLNKLFKGKNNQITNEEIFPNYHSIETGTKMMVFYNTSHNHKLKDNRNIHFYKNINFSPINIFENIYGNKLKVVPNFKKMLPRESKDLPCYLNGITSRNNCLVNTGKSFKMNNYFNSTMYNLREDLNKNVNKYRNEKLKEMRKCLSFENLNAYKKDRYLYELDNKMKKFNGILSQMKE